MGLYDSSSVRAVEGRGKVVEAEEVYVVDAGDYVCGEKCSTEAS